MRKHKGFIIFFSVIIGIFLWKIFSLKWGFLEGDYKDQFYPWSYIYSQSLKNFGLSFWTRYVQSGFPLIAEGQVGGFYPLNILFFGLLPFKLAYNYIVILHFVLAGVFAYLYSRKLGACQWGGSLAAFVFCFGSAYAGCFYNTVTVKTLIWVPLAFYLLETYFDTRKARVLFTAGFVLGIQFLAGFAQLAAYSALFYVIYFITGLLSRDGIKYKDIAAGLGSLILSAVIFYPQLASSLPLVEASSRQGSTLAFALWGSFSPMNFMSTVVPYWIFQGTRFYIGVISLLFLAASFVEAKKDVMIRPLIWVFLLAVFLSLGKYNPFYVLVLKAFDFYSFRNPSKFMFFAVLAASVLSGIGFTRFFAAGKQHQLSAARIFGWITCSLLALFFAAKVILRYFGDRILEAGKWYASNYIYGKAHHRFDLEIYMQKVQSYYSAMVEYSSLSNPFVLFSVLMTVACVIAAVFFVKHKGNIKALKTAAFALVLADLYVFSLYGTGFRGNIKSYDILEPEKSALLEIVRSEPEPYRILPFGLASGKLPNWAVPSLNAVYGVDSAAMYSPLVMDRYRKAMQGLEAVDNSLGLMPPEVSALNESIPLLKILNVKYIVSYRVIGLDAVKLSAEEGGVRLYEIQGTYPRFFCAEELVDPRPDKSIEVDVIEYKSGFGRFLVNMPYSGYFIFSETYFEGWTATVNGREKRIIPVSLVQAVELPPGENSIEFRFSTYKK